MNQDRAHAAPKPLPMFLRVVCIALAILLVLGSALDYFGDLPRQADQLFATASVLFAPVPLSMAFISWPHQTPQLSGALSLGLLGVSVVFVSGLIGFMANIFPLLSLPATILAWLGVAMLVVGDLLLVGAFGRTVLTRLRTSV